MSKDCDLIVIGGGVSGMSAATTAAECGLRVLLLEGRERVGKKLLSTGNGRCNFTNEAVDVSFYYDADPELIMSVIGEDEPQKLLSWMRSMGIEGKAVSGRYYPRSEQASAVLDAMRIRMERAGVRIRTGAKVLYVREAESGCFEVQTADDIFTCPKVILAAGSKAAPHTGSDGSGYVLARQLGLSVRQPLPALTGIKLDSPYCKSWNGVRCDGRITVFIDGRKTAHDTGQLQLSAYGVSGIPTFQVSRYVSKALSDGQDVTVSLSFMPDYTEEEALIFLRERSAVLYDYALSDFYLGVLPRNLASVLIRASGVDRSAKCGALSEKNLHHMAAQLTGMSARAVGTGSFEQAQVCTGGVASDQLRPGTLECVDHPGLYVTGELVDVDGMCGGYNLQWAFSSGICAGRAAGMSRI